MWNSNGLSQCKSGRRPGSRIKSVMKVGGNSVLLRFFPGNARVSCRACGVPRRAPSSTANRHNTSAPLTATVRYVRENSAANTLVGPEYAQRSMPYSAGRNTPRNSKSASIRFTTMSARPTATSPQCVPCKNWRPSVALSTSNRSTGCRSNNTQSCNQFASLAPALQPSRFIAGLLAHGMSWCITLGASRA